MRELNHNMALDFPDKLHIKQCITLQICRRI